MAWVERKGGNDADDEHEVSGQLIARLELHVRSQQGTVDSGASVLTIPEHAAVGLTKTRP